MSGYRDKIANRKQAGFYKPADINGEEAEVAHTIAFLSQDEEHYGQKSDVLHFADTPKYLRLSTFNAEILMDLFGEEPEDWKGQQITLFVEEYQPGKTAIRVKAANDPF